jgi:diguanylate cyclase (GGDEF)-like protein
LLRKLSDLIARQSQVTIVAVAVLVIVALGVVDYFIGESFSASLFFLLPIAAVAWYSSRGAAICLSVLSGICLLATDWAFRTGEHEALSLWNAIFPFFFFIGFVILLTLLKDSLAREALLSRTDPLTGLNNRRYFDEMAEAEMSRSRRYDHPVSLAYVDLDNFKAVNDSMGHGEGDEVLVVVAQNLKAALRSTDVIARMGGDEFAVLLPETGAEAAAKAMKDVEEDMKARSDEHGWPITMSIGVVSYPVAPGTLDEMINEADALMYTIKQASKDSIAFKTIDTRQ